MSLIDFCFVSKRFETEFVSEMLMCQKKCTYVKKYVHMTVSEISTYVHFFVKMYIYNYVQKNTALVSIPRSSETPEMKLLVMLRPPHVPYAHPTLPEHRERLSFRREKIFHGRVQKRIQIGSNKVLKTVNFTKISRNLNFFYRNSSKTHEGVPESL